MRFEYWQSDADGRWYFHAKARNNEIFLASQGYTTEAHVRRAIRMVIRSCRFGLPGVRKIVG